MYPPPNASSDLPDSLPLWLNYLEHLHPHGEAGIELGLERARQVSSALRQRPFCPILTVAGTNGKGSTVACLASILNAAGYRVGSYTSPHLLRFNERIRINLHDAEDDALCAAFAAVEMARRAAGDISLTYFEFATLAAWQLFTAARCEVLVLEVGMGGRLDAVNLYDSDISLVTTVDLDHQDWLGNDRETIALEKAGIFRPRRPALYGDFNPPNSLIARAADLNAPLSVLGRDFGYQKDSRTRQWTFWRNHPEGVERRNFAYPGLTGDMQLKNATLAIATLKTLETQLPVPMQAIRDGLIYAELPARFQVLPGKPAIVLDVGHNPQAARTLAENLANMGFYEKTYAVFGMLANKDITGSIAVLAKRITHWFLASLDGPRGLTAEALALRIQTSFPAISCSCHANPEEAFLQATDTAGENDRIVIFGSFHTVAALSHTVTLARRKT
ncbi:MAG: bifunctional tetrahydrofolate synthase/dihydrofolate synthase [Betaproteobacteria bacterium]|nr:bifunctional tetrahydrofolate synthase/dihydrofolate synthase [Betaproteobacteria bacterium]